MTTFARRGWWSAVAAYGLWGVLPVYWKLLQTVSAPQILAHRIVWSLAFLGGLLVLRGEVRPLLTALTRRTAGLYAGAAVLLATNWLTYIWGVNAGRIVETSLGYFINPLVSVVLAVVFLRERLRLAQWLAVALAGVGVAYLTWHHGTLPWIALVLAVTFALYALVKKLAPLPALQGLALETAVLGLPAAGALILIEARGTGAFGHAGPATTLLLALTGVITAFPLLLFASAARRIPLSTLGLLQYLSPSLALAVGVWGYGERFDRARAVGFGLIWLALALYSIEGAWYGRWRRRPAPEVPRGGGGARRGAEHS